MVFRRRRQTRGTIIQSVKNQHNVTISAVGGATNNFPIATAVDVGVATKITGQEVPTGAIVTSLILWVQCDSSSGGVSGEVTWYIAKRRGGQVNADLPIPDFTAMGLSDLRNQIIHSDTSLYGTQDAGPYRFKMLVRIPKLYHRMRSGDQLVIRIASSVATSMKVAFIYKYYQ